VVFDGEILPESPFSGGRWQRARARGADLLNWATTVGRVIAKTSSRERRKPHSIPPTSMTALNRYRRIPEWPRRLSGGAPAGPTFATLTTVFSEFSSTGCRPCTSPQATTPRGGGTTYESLRILVFDASPIGGGALPPRSPLVFGNALDFHPSVLPSIARRLQPRAGPAKLAQPVGRSRPTAISLLAQSPPTGADQ